MAPRQVQVCAFCPETANLTGEHLFADWIDKILTGTTTHYDFTDIDPETSKERKYKSRHLNRKFKAVCATCNNGWMSDIDNDARNTLKDVIRHRASVSFLRSGLKAIATFTLKNAFVADYMHQKPFWSEYPRGQFKEHRKFPPGMHMWFGAILTERHMRHGIYRTMYGKPSVNTDLGIETYVFTWSAECLLLQLVAARWQNVLHLARDGWPSLSQDAHLNATFTPLWPNVGRAMWPPIRWVSHNDLDAVSSRFGMINFVA
jgi:hypothetical protein